MRSKLGYSDRVKENAHVGGALRSKRFLKLPLRFDPSLHPRPETGFASFCHSQLLAAAIAAALFHDDQAVALQRQDVAAEGGSVHHHLRGEGINRHRAQTSQLRKNRKLSRAQPAWSQQLIVELCDVPRGLAHRETVAILRSRISTSRHRKPPS